MATAGPQRPYKLPESVLVVIHTPALDVLLIRRTGGEGHWQSVTGSKDALEEPFAETARREVAEETGMDTQAPGCLLTDWALENVYDIWPQWLHRYAPGVVRNHYSLGASLKSGPGGEWSVAYTRVPRTTVSGSGSIPTSFGGGEADPRMSQDVLTVGYSWAL